MKKTDVLLDLLPDVDIEPEVAHDSEEKEEKEEIEQGPIKVKRSKKTSEEDDEEGTDTGKLWQYAKYAAVAGFVVIIIELVIAHKRRKKGKGMDMQEMMMMMMYQMMMVQMQNMQNQQQHKEVSLPPEVVTDDGTSFSTDWSEWFERNKGKEFNKFGSSETKILNKMHVAENWELLRRDLTGKILDVNKTNEYIR